jgi:hypothetical protein
MSELTQWASERDRPSSGIRLAYVLVYSFRTQIFKSGTFFLIERLLGDLLERISALFEPTSHELSFILVSWKIENQLPIVSTTSFGSQLQFDIKNRTVRVSLRPGGWAKIIRSIFASVNLTRRKTSRVPPAKFARTKGLRVSPETKTIGYKTENCIPTGCTYASFTKKVHDRTYSSVRTSGYISLKKQGKLPPQPYSMVVVDVEPGSFTSFKQWTGQPWFVNFTSFANPNLLDTDIPLGHLSVDENLLISKLAGKINKSQANLAEDIVQHHQTTRLLTENVIRFGTFLSLVTGGSPESVRRFLGNAKGSSSFVRGLKLLRKSGLSGVGLLAQLWLEYRYGWLPLVQDLDAAVGAFHTYVKKSPGIQSVTASRRKTTNVIRKVVYATNPNGSPRTRFYYEKVSTVCKIGIRYQLDSKLVNTMAGFGLTSPVSLAWELIPFSFVVDWFLPIGSAIQAFSAFEGLTFMSGYKTYFTKSNVLLKVSENYTHVDVNPLNSYVLKDKGSCFGFRVTMNRSVLSNFPSPSTPKLKNPLSLIHAANAAALVTRLLTK